MYKIFLKWFLIAFISLLLISYAIVIYYIGFNQLLNVLFEDIYYNLLMLSSPTLVVAILLTRWELKKT